MQNDNELTLDQFFDLIDSSSAEEFIMKIDLYGLNGPFSEYDSKDTVVMLIANHQLELAIDLYDHGMFKVGEEFINRKSFESISPNGSYIHNGLKTFLDHVNSYSLS